MKINPLNAIDFYKADHRRQYPDGTEFVYSNFTPRSAHLAPYSSRDGVVVFGIQLMIKEFLIDSWNEGFFNQPIADVLQAYKRRMDTSLGKDAIDTAHIEALHTLGYLPLHIKALPEGTLSPIGTPVLTIINTHPDFFWLTNYLETVISSELWKMITSATTAYNYRRILNEAFATDGSPPEAAKFMVHDFSFRGLSGRVDAAKSGLAHLLSFVGTDSVVAIDAAEDYYNANCETEIIGMSVPATEHSVMCMGGEPGEVDTFRRLYNEVYPTGIVSIVSDSWDFWRVIDTYLPMLKDEIMARDGKIVIRPDSGDPVKIICGDPEAERGSPEYYGAVDCLWKTFGGTETDEGYRVLDSHIGLIYGDSITIDRFSDIIFRLHNRGYAACNVVFGVGSYTYQYCTRDTYGFAMKATWGVVDGKERMIYKDPKTDSGTKKSARGLLYVADDLKLFDQVSPHQEELGALKTVFLDGQIVKEFSLQDIRDRLNGDIF